MRKALLTAMLAMALTGPAMATDYEEATGAGMLLTATDQCPAFQTYLLDNFTLEQLKVLAAQVTISGKKSSSGLEHGMTVFNSLKSALGLQGVCDYATGLFARNLGKAL